MFEHVGVSTEQFDELDGVDERLGRRVGTNATEMRFVQTTVPGNDEKGYLGGIDGEWRDTDIRALPAERTVIGRVGSRVDHQ